MLRFRELACCVCGSESASRFCRTIDRLHGVDGEFQYVACGTCGLVYQNPQVVPEDIPKLYPEDYAPWGAMRAARLPNWKRRLRDAITITGLPKLVRRRLDESAGAALLDVGCGSGKFMARVAADHPGALVEGIDFSPQAAAEAARGGFTVHTGTLSELAPRLSHYDVITMWWVLEHLPDPEAELRLCCDLLKPGGIFACGVPNARSLSRAVFRGRWYHLDPPRHLWIFHPGNLKQLMKRVGFEVVYVKPDYSPWGTIGSLQYAMRGSNANARGASWVDNRMLNLALRPVGLLQGAIRLGDTFAMYARRPE